MERSPVQIRFLGHAALLVEASGGQTLLVDPFNPGGFGGRMAYRPIPYAPDAVVCSHAHLDHAAHELLPGAPHILAEEPVSEFGPFLVRRHSAWHDEYRGRRRGGAVDILQIEVGGLEIVHLSDVGHSPTAKLTQALGAPDILCVPVGGFYTIGAAQAFEWCQRLGPRLILPIHYRTARCALPLRSLQSFLAHFPPHQLAGDLGGGSFIEVDSTMISFSGSVVVLAPEC